MMSGNPFELQFNVVKLDKTGSGEMIPLLCRSWTT